MEIEAKYVITADLDPARIAALRLEPYSLSASGVENHTDTLLDTRDRKITSGRRGLRVRAVGATLTLTLKGANTGSGGVHVRQEWEAPLPTPLSLDPESWPAPIGPTVVAIVGGEPLVPLLRIVVQRQTWAVKRGGRTVGELALDTGVILAAGRRESIYELELELKGSGARADLEALNVHLMADLPLQPESRSKLQRGLALLLHDKWTLDGYTPFVSLASHYIRQKVRATEAAMRDVARDRSPDAIHDMRVAIRRLRSALLELETVAVFDRREAKLLRTRLRAIARRLGVVRDQDIAIELVTRVESAGVDNVARARLAARLRIRRAQSYQMFQRTLQSDRFLRTLDRLRRCAIARLDGAGAPNCAPARDFVGGVLWARFDALMRHDMAIQLGNTLEMHQARIAAKRLRYTIEVFAPSLPTVISPVRQALIAFQEAFGTLQDFTTTLAAISDIYEDGEDAATLSAIRDELEADRDRALRGARAAWVRLSSPTIRSSLATAIAAI